MAPGLYIPLRSSSSTSSRARLPAAACSSSSRHRQAAAAAPASTALPAVAAATAVAPHSQLPFPAFHTSSRSIIVPSAHPKNVNTEGGQLARLGRANSSLNYSSSGSLHHAHDHDDPSSVCLAAMVHQFLEEEEKEEEEIAASLSPAGSSGCGRARCNCVDGVCGDEFCAITGEEEDDESNVSAQVEILQGYANCSNKAEGLVRREVEQAIEELIAVPGDVGRAVDGRDGFRRPVMGRLREAGYNAAACKSRWSHGNGLPPGDYEYIDVLLDASKQADPFAPVQLRLIVDIDFQAQFEIARPSREYLRLLDAVPKVFVGRAERVKQVVRMMSQAAKRSLRARGLLVPPWRKHKYMQAKWLSPIYRRTTKTEASNIMQMKPAPGQMRKRVGERSERLHNIAMHEEASVLYKVRPLPNVGKCRDVCTAMCTSWRLPSLLVEYEERAAAPALTRVSALSIAFAGERALNQAVLGVVS